MYIYITYIWEVLNNAYTFYLCWERVWEVLNNAYTFYLCWERVCVCVFHDCFLICLIAENHCFRFPGGAHKKPRTKLTRRKVLREWFRETSKEAADLQFHGK